MDDDINNAERTDLPNVQNVQEFIIDVIRRLRDRELSYENIGARLGISKSQAKMILDRTWWPKDERRVNKILLKIIEEKER